MTTTVTQLQQTLARTTTTTNNKSRTNNDNDYNSINNSNCILAASIELIPLGGGGGSFLLCQVFEGIVKELLVKNGHRATVEGVPNTELEASIDGKEKGLLQGVKDDMSDQVCCLFFC